MARGRVTKYTGRNTYKNVIDSSGGLASGTASVTDIAVAVESLNLDQDSNEVPIGGKLSAIFYSLYVFADTTASVPIVDVFWWKNTANQFTQPTPGNTGVDQNKSKVFHEEKGLAGPKDTGVPMVIKGVLRIPPVLQRFGLADRIQMVLESQNVAGDFCAKHIYKVIY